MPQAVPIIGALIGAGASIHGTQQAKKSARRAREQQEKELAAQRVLDAAQQQALKRAEDDKADIEIGKDDLTIGTRRKAKREVRNAPTTGLRVG